VHAAPTAVDLLRRKESQGEAAIAGFLLPGFLAAVLGAMLPAWGFHRDPPDFIVVGNYFLVLAVGLVLAVVLARRLAAHVELKWLLTVACAIASASLVALAVLPPAAVAWRPLPLLFLGFGGGLLSMALFHAVPPEYLAESADTVSRAGAWYGMGCLIATLVLAGTVASSWAAWMTLPLAALPVGYGIAYGRVNWRQAKLGEPTPLHQILRDFRSPGAIMFALLLFFQFGNEWSIAGWLPLFLIRRVGVSPRAALTILAFYWLCLMVGHVVAAAVLRHFSHARVLLASALAALLGCLILFLTDNPFGATAGTFFLGAGFASIYPLVLEAIGRRFPYYHPGFFNGVFSLAMLGGLLAPCTVGYGAEIWGVGVMMGIPLLGTITVVALLLLIWLEAKVTGR
jgi:MFS transporter, FHS family, glucose/mannose:H+ symporter